MDAKCDRFRFTLEPIAFVIDDRLHIFGARGTDYGLVTMKLSLTPNFTITEFLDRTFAASPAANVVFKRRPPFFVRNGLHFAYNDRGQLQFLHLDLQTLEIRGGVSQHLTGDVAQYVYHEEKMYVLTDASRCYVFDAHWSVTQFPLRELAKDDSCLLWRNCLLFISDKLEMFDLDTREISTHEMKNAPVISPRDVLSMKVYGDVVLYIRPASMNQLYELDLNQMQWRTIKTSGKKPLGFSNSLLTLIWKDHLLACGYRNLKEVFRSHKHGFGVRKEGDQFVGIFGGACELSVMDMRGREDLYTDVTFHVHGRIFRGHRCILSRNAYFQKLFETGETDITLDEDPEAFEQCLEYLQGFVPEVTDALKLYMLADKIDEDGLKRVAILLLLKIDKDEPLKFMQQLLVIDSLTPTAINLSLKKMVAQVLADNLEKLLEKPECRKFSEEHPGLLRTTFD